MAYPAHDAFVAPARAHPQIWLLVAGFIVACLVAVLWVITLFGAVYLFAGVEGGPAWIERMTRADTPTSALLVIATLWGLAIGAMVVARLFHRRGIGTLFGPARRVRRDFMLATLVCGGFIGVSALLPYGFEAIPNLDLSLWLSFLPLALVVLIGQTGAEELFFRGYLQQQLAARFRSPLVWMLVPSLLFGLAHYDPANGPAVSWMIVAATGVFGLCAADLTAHTGSIGAAWGFHFANNVAAILILSMDGALSGLALYTGPIGATDTDAFLPLLLRDMVTTVLIWGAIRLAIARLGR